VKNLLAITSFTILAASTINSVHAQEELIYVAVTPCRIADTRQSAAGAIGADTFQNFRVSGSAGELAVQGGTTDCPNPKGGERPVAISAYLLAIPADSSTDQGVLTAYPSDQPSPPPGAGSTVNFAQNQIIGNTTNVTICSKDKGCPSDGELAVLARKTDEHLVIDIQGYFYRATSLTGYQVVNAGFTVANSNGFIAQASCPAGKKALGGGGSLVSSSWFLDGSYPLGDGSGWRVSYKSTGQFFSASGFVWAVCAVVD
jgi:hypothetical protein